MYSTNTAASVFESSPGYSSFISNSLESLWGVLDSLIAAPEETLTVQTLLDEIEGVHNTWYHDLRLADLVHYPSGHNFFTPALMRGEGRLSVLGGLYNKQFRRMTVASMEILQVRGKKFYDHFEEVKDDAIWTQKRLSF